MVPAVIQTPNFNPNIPAQYGIRGPRPTGTDLLTTQQQALAQQQAQAGQLAQSQQQGNQMSKDQANYWDNVIVPGYYMGQMASAMGGGPAGGALAGAAQSGLGMLYNYFQNKYSQGSNSGTYGEGAPVGHGIPSTSTQYGDD